MMVPSDALAIRPVEQDRSAGWMGDDERRRFGQAVRAARAAKGWSQQELADATATRQAYISQVEKGAVPITIDTMARLARALGKELHDLVKG